MIQNRNADIYGQTIAVGFILLLGVLVIFVSWFQITQLPEINRDAEIDYQNEVDGSMTGLRDTIWDLTRDADASIGSARVITVVDYPLQQSKSSYATAQVRFNITDNAYSIDNINGSDPLVDTSQTTIKHQPRYFVRTERNTIIENNIVAGFSDNSFERTIAPQLLVSNESIYISEIDPTSQSIVQRNPTFEIVRNSRQVTTIEPNNETSNYIEFTFSSELSEDFWTDAFNNIDAVRTVNKNSGSISVTLDNKEYTVYKSNIEISTP